MKVDRQIFDAHFHIGKHGTQQASDRLVTPILQYEELVDYQHCVNYLRRYHIVGGLIVPTYLPDQKAAFEFNKLILDGFSNRDADGLYGGLWVSPLPEVMDFTEETFRFVPHPKIKAIKMSANTWGGFTASPRTWPATMKSNMDFIVNKAYSYNLIIHFHTGEGRNDAECFSDFLAEYGKGIRIQFVHMGETLSGAFRFVPRFIEWVEAGYDVYCDTSLVPGFAPGWLISQLLQIEGGIDRILFATDSPWGRLPSEYWKIEDLNIEETLKDKVFWYNALKLYGE